MKVLIVEDDAYLLIGLQEKFGSLGHETTVLYNIDQIVSESSFYDVVLLSSAVHHTDIERVITAHKVAIIIMMVQYVSFETVSKPLSIGANDYIRRPFDFNDLYRKIVQHREYDHLRRMESTYVRYIEHSLRSIMVDAPPKDLKLPVLLLASQPIVADAFVFKYAKSTGQKVHILILDRKSDIERIHTMDDDALIYIRSLEKFTQREFTKIESTLMDKNIIMTSSVAYKCSQICMVVDQRKEMRNNKTDEIMQIEEYVRYVIKNYESHMSETDLAKKLGLSRKSLWERRKKYNIPKKKKSA